MLRSKLLDDLFEPDESGDSQQGHSAGFWLLGRARLKDAAPNTSGAVTTRGRRAPADGRMPAAPSAAGSMPGRRVVVHSGRTDDSLYDSFGRAVSLGNTQPPNRSRLLERARNEHEICRAFGWPLVVTEIPMLDADAGPHTTRGSRDGEGLARNRREPRRLHLPFTKRSRTEFGSPALTRPWSRSYCAAAGPRSQRPRSTD
jgi:hypothetical protein